MNTAETGSRGEAAAAEWLRSNGFELCERNWRNGRYEIDIIARKAGELHIVEVKTRRSGSLTPPEAAITRQKELALRKAAQCYAAWTRWPGEIRFDLAAVEMRPDGSARVDFIPDAIQMHW